MKEDKPFINVGTVGHIDQEDIPSTTKVGETIIFTESGEGLRIPVVSINLSPQEEETTLQEPLWMVKQRNKQFKRGRK